MALYDQANARHTAQTMIVEAIKSGSIKLIGPAGRTSPEGGAEDDAKYLSQLLIKLTAKISSD